MTSADEEFRGRLQEARQKIGLSQSELARQMQERGHDFHPQTINKIERGNRRITLGEAVDLAALLGYSVEGLVGTADDELLALGATVTAADRQLDRAIHEYVSALVQYTVAADRLDHAPREAQEHFLTQSIPKQTPAMISRDAFLTARAKLAREGVSPGRYARILLAALQRDEVTLDAAQAAVVVDPDTGDFTVTSPSRDEHVTLLRDIFGDMLRDSDG